MSVRSQEAEARIMLLNRQQELNGGKKKAQQATVIWATKGVRVLKMMADNDVEAYLRDLQESHTGYWLGLKPVGQSVRPSSGSL